MANLVLNAANVDSVRSRSLTCFLSLKAAKKNTIMKGNDTMLCTRATHSSSPLFSTSYIQAKKSFPLLKPIVPGELESPYI